MWTSHSGLSTLRLPFYFYKKFQPLNLPSFYNGQLTQQSPSKPNRSGSYLNEKILDAPISRTGYLLKTGHVIYSRQLYALGSHAQVL